MLGSVFSPYYAWSGRGDPLNHCVLNVCLYGPGGRWAMTERGKGQVARAPRRLTIGPSRVEWDGAALTFHIKERCAPLPFPVEGRVVLRPRKVTSKAFSLDPNDRHRWWPIAPHSEISVEMTQPSLSWTGEGYWDSNWGTESLEAGFKGWWWTRAPLADGGAAILYDTTPRGGGDGARIALRFPPGGEAESFEAPPEAALPSTGVWRIGRATRADAGHAPSVARTVEDTPFYARSILDTHILGEPVRAMHENLDMDRFNMTIVKLMLPFRMPRLPFGEPSAG
ncbi:carotenoid 1,2-hydratase [Rhodospira trueperi]|uniref:Carotenoid 1,2-hydratase n=1 Tax=Rhodospira trueperi TaxID=69960 RepID=A0A1G6ZWB9_9PROT|nr:carotenoid 1,2-hydratase [Rhodospira trueperi]SDE06810.1 carotenoid 1,2-hydratase [Rhodospira trueperi]